MAKLSFLCPRCLLPTLEKVAQGLSCSRCYSKVTGSGAYLDYLGNATNATDDHYTLQWGREKGFFDFLRKHPSAKSVMPAGQLGWPQLFEEIRERATKGPEALYVYDAACGFGGIASELINNETKNHLMYVGADIHHALPNIIKELPLLEKCGFLLRWDISKALPVTQCFDYVICRAAIHHTPDPRATFQSLVERLKPGGQIAITVYRKKGMAREALDDCFRDYFVPKPTAEAYALARQFTLLGKNLQSIKEKVYIEEDLPIFGIAKGEHAVQTLFYNYFMKCFYNPSFGEEYSTLVNFDWYHPPFAYRYDLPEVMEWFAESRLTVHKTDAIEAQYFVLGKK